jgi:hypothetical protein
MRVFKWALVFLAAGAAMPPAACQGGEITRQGKVLEKILDGMNVEKLWLSRRYVDWKTGRTREKPVTDGKMHTHCSAFVAAVCRRLNVYILRPPNHSTMLLANAQFDWLHQAGGKEGWTPVRTAREAQRLANKGFLVVATLKENDPKKPGHIAVVRPCKKSGAKIDREGPQIIQAGASNMRSASLKEGFKNHPSASATGMVRYFAHERNTTARRTSRG